MSNATSFIKQTNLSCHRLTCTMRYVNPIALYTMVDAQCDKLERS